MSLFCRLCLANYPQNELKNIYCCNIEYSKDSLVDILFWVFSVEIDVTDPYTKDICTECILLIEYVVEIRNTFKKSQELLRKAEYEKEEVSELHSSNNAGVLKLDNNEKSSTRTNIPRNHSYSQSSPRVRVAVATLDALCPLRLNLVRLEDSREYMNYKPLGHGRFKRMKYRHFKLDDKLLDDICSTLDDKEDVKNGMLKRDAFMVAQANNTDKKYASKSSARSQNVISSERNNEDEFDDESLMEIIKITKDISSHILSPELDKDYDWTSLNFKKDAGTNTESTRKVEVGTLTEGFKQTSLSHKKNAGTNTESTKKVEAETLTEEFGETANKNTVKVDVLSLSNFSPKVWLEPVELLIGRENYKEIDDFCYIKHNVSENKDGVELGQYHEDPVIEDPQKIILSEKKQRFLDYYKNFSSFAVRELIAGKKIRESGDDTRSIFRVSNVHNVFVCNFCSKSFLTETVLNMHCKRAHRSVDTSLVHVENNAADKTQRYKNCMLRKIKKRRGRKKIQLNKKDPYSLGYNVNNMSFASEMNCTGPQRDIVNHFSNNAKRLSLGLRTKNGMTNYNISSMTRNSTKVNHISNGRKRRSKKSVGGVVVKKHRNNKLTEPIGNGTDATYIWDRKGLGTYSAISFYRKHVTADTEINYNETFSDLNKKEDNALNETIRKLADRLEELGNTDSSDLYPT